MLDRRIIRLLMLALPLAAVPAAASPGLGLRGTPAAEFCMPSGILDWRLLDAPGGSASRGMPLLDPIAGNIAGTDPGSGGRLDLAPAAAVPGLHSASSFPISDRWFALISTAGVATAYGLDQHVWAAATDSGAATSHAVANVVARLGDFRYLGSALAASYVVGRLASLPGASSASARIGGAVLVAGASSGVLKIAAGRSRPDAAPGDPDEFAPFTGKDSFPSGHTTVAFAFASALDRETRSAWVPWVAYPAAAAVGWARIVQDRHWFSDVVGGAALGTWIGGRVDMMLQHRAHNGTVVSPMLRISSRSGRAGLAMRF
jgi:membrane-associated phospholipid phosphatase